MRIKQYRLRSDGDFGILEEPRDKKQHPNQQGGLDRYIRVLNFGTGECCDKKLYRNGKGLHFKHTGFGSRYLDDFTEEVIYVPYQIFNVVDCEKCNDTGKTPSARYCDCITGSNRAHAEVWADSGGE